VVFADSFWKLLGSISCTRRNWNVDGIDIGYGIDLDGSHGNFEGCGGRTSFDEPQNLLYRFGLCNQRVLRTQDDSNEKSRAAMSSYVSQFERYNDGSVPLLL